MKRFLRLSLAIAGTGLVVFTALLICVPSPVEDALSWPVSPALLDARGGLFHVRLSSREEYCLPVPLGRMGKWLPLVAVSVEDKRFYSHPGVDPLALARAAWQNISSGAIISGASTISSQVVRLTYPSQRIFTSKAREFLQALKLELALDKQRILELYLNRAPFGGPVRGVEAAARSYFGKRAEELSLAEAALLIGMLRGPSLYRPDKNPEKTLERRNTILRRLLENSEIEKHALELALLEPLPPGRSDIPHDAWHFAEFSFRLLPRDYWEKAGKPVATTLQPHMQRLLELALAEGLASFPEEITAAGGIVDPETTALVAYAGNRRFDLPMRKHWVDCGFSLRSPGSMLKPFVYLLAFEQGRLIPASLLADSPLAFAGEAPRNYDRSYSGPVSAGLALANSLNAPAVRVLRLAGNEAALQFLRLLGFRGLGQAATHYGDSLVLGGCEVTLLQLLQAYSALATLGLDRPLTSLRDNAVQGRLGEQRLFSAAGGYLTADSLRHTGRMSPLLRITFDQQDRKVAFKTGTSYGLRDAWAAAYTPNVVVGVWLGNPEGLPHPGLSGLPVAAPLALRIMRDLPLPPADTRWFSPPDTLERFLACSLSGKPVSPACPGSSMQWRIKDVSQNQPCTLHVVHEGKTRTILPPELESFAAQRGGIVARKERIDITSPLPGTRYFITPEAPTQHLALTSEGAKGTVYWFINQEFFGMQEKGASLLWPLNRGKYTISLVDQDGRTASGRFEVVDIMQQEPRLLPLLP